MKTEMLNLNNVEVRKTISEWSPGKRAKYNKVFVVWSEGRYEEAEIKEVK